MVRKHSRYEENNFLHTCLTMSVESVVAGSYEDRKGMHWGSQSLYIPEQVSSRRVVIRACCLAGAAAAAAAMSAACGNGAHSRLATDGGATFVPKAAARQPQAAA